MKCGVIFYFLSLDPLEITHSILKEEGFLFPSFLRGGILARGQKNIFSAPPAPPQLCFLGVHARYSLQLIIQIHFEMQGYTLSGLF